MKLVCSQLELNSALQLVSRAVATRPTHPVLANVLMTADAGTNRLSLTGFDLNLGIQTSFTASVEISGAITLPAKLFVEIVSRLSSDSPISLFTDEIGDQLELKSLSGSYQMRGMSADEFPELPLVENGFALKVNASSLLKGLRGTLFSSSSDEAKQLLTGVHLTFNGHLMEAAATDGHRLAILSLEEALISESINAEPEQQLAVTLPSRSLREVERLISSWKEDDPISIFYDSGQVVFLADDQVLTSRTLEGNYPNYRQLLPDQFLHNIEIDRRLFISALERIAVLADQHNNVVKISLTSNDDLMKITTDAQDVGSGSESIPAIYQGDSFEIAFNVRYVLEGLKVIDSSKVNLACNAPTTPAVISPIDDENGFTYLVMPVQIRA